MSFKNYFNSDKFERDFKQINTLIDKQFDRIDRDIFNQFKREEPKESLHLKKEGYSHLYILAPGFSKEELTIDISGQYVKVNGKRSMDRDLAMLLKTEISHSFYIGDMDEENVAAKLTNGVLEIKIPYKEKQKTKIKID